MGNRLSKIYTRTGDDGSTGLGDGLRVAKDSLRIEAIGNADELNSLIGLVVCSLSETHQKNTLNEIQHDLFDIGGELSMPGHRLFKDQRTEWLEQELDLLNEHLPPLKEFILPGGNIAAAQTHQARSVCRRLERSLVSLNRQEDVSTDIISYVNRLSDFLFVLARTVARENGGQEVLWRHDRTQQ